MDPKLYLAATSGDVGFLEQVAGSGNLQLLLSKAPHENTALHIAARFGHADFAEKILPLCNQLLKIKNSNDDTALHCAARAGCSEMVEILVDYELRTADHVEEGGSSVGLLRMQNKAGDTALHQALRNQREEMAIKMLRADPKLSFVVNKANESPFLLASKEDMEEVVKEMLSIDPSGNSVEQQAAAISNTSSGLLNGPDKEGNTPVHFASKEDACTFLLGDSRADLTVRNEDGQTVLALNSYYRLLPCSDQAWGWHRDIPNVIPKTEPPPEEGGAFQRAHQVLLVVASLIATVTFAAAFTMPGGYRSSNEPNPGTAVLQRKRAFKAFLFFDTLAMCLSMAAIFCYILGWKVWPHRVGSTFLTWGNLFTMVACLLMLFAFSHGVSVAAESMNPLVGAICLSVLYFVAVPISVSACTVLYLVCRIQRARKASGLAHKKCEPVPVVV